ncbi:MAG: tyrosine--tRNA ligase [Alphaproteobacteria bacterium]
MASDFISLSKERGFVYQSTGIEKLEALVKNKKIVGYLGFDATAKSLHVGSLLGIMWLRLFQKTGNKPIVLLGGATTKIGDPTWKDKQRPLLKEEEVNANIKNIQKVFKKFLYFGENANDAMLVNNEEWLSKLNYLELLRDHGTHFSVNRMLSFDSVKTRLEREQPLSFLEFNYMILQSYDFLELYKNHNCCLQMGGSDQWSNIICGVELIRKVLDKNVYGITAPLITTSSGKKMGKTEKGAVWLDEELLSPYDYWQFWRNTEDQDVGKYLKIFTELPMSEIKRLEMLKGAELNEAKKILADESTTLLHGKDALPKIHKAVKELFEKKEGNTEYLPYIDIDFKDTYLTVDTLFVLAGLCSSKSEARRLIENKGAYINDEVIKDYKQLISKNEVIKKQCKLSFGKKKHIVVRVK